MDSFGVNVLLMCFDKILFIEGFFIYLLVDVAVLDLRLSQFFSFFLFPAHLCFSVW